MDDKNTIQLPEGVRMDSFGGIHSVWLMDDIWQEQFIGMVIIVLSSVEIIMPYD